MDHGCGQGGHPHPSQGALQWLPQPRDWRSAGNRTLRGCAVASGGAPALPGEGDCRGQSSQDRARQTRGPWTRRCRSSCAVNLLVAGSSSSGCAFFLPSVGVLTSRKARAHLCACACLGPARLQASGDHRPPALWSGHSLLRPCCWLIPGALWRLWVRAAPACCLAVGTAPGWPPTPGRCPASAQGGVLGNRRSYPEPSSPGSCSAPFSPTWNCSCDLILPVWL